MSSLLKSYLLGIFIASLLFGVAAVLIILKTDPYTQGDPFLFLFLISLFFFLTGIFSLIGFYLRLWFSRKEIIYSHLAPSMRQGMLLSLYLVGLLILQIFRLVNIWTAGLFFLIIFTLELIFRTKKF